MIEAEPRVVEATEIVECKASSITTRLKEVTPPTSSTVAFRFNCWDAVIIPSRVEVVVFVVTEEVVVTHTVVASSTVIDFDVGTQGAEHICVGFVECTWVAAAAAVAGVAVIEV
jgi:hypothetical protein